MLQNLRAITRYDSTGPAHDRNGRRRSIVVKDTLYVYCAYIITILITLAARSIDLTDISYTVLAGLFLWASALTALFIAIAASKKTVTLRFARAHYTGQFAVWLFTYAFWIYHIGAIRSAGLLFALMAMAFLLPNSNLLESYLLAASIALVQAFVAAWGIHFAGQPGSMVTELFYILCFFPAALFISFLAGQYERQREKARRARLQAAASRDAIWKVIRKTADAGGDTLHDALYLVNLVFEYCGADGGCLFAMDAERGRLDPVFTKLEKNSARAAALMAAAETAAGLREPEPGGNTIFCVAFMPARGSSGVCSMVSPRMIGSVEERELEEIRAILSRCAGVLSRSPVHGEPSETGREERTVLTASSVEKIEKAVAYIRENFTSEISRDGLASHLDISPNYFGKLFAEYTGKKMNDFIIDLRVEEAMKLLRSTDRQIIDIAFEVGFNNLRTFNRAFSKNLSRTPQEYRRSGRP